MFKQPMLSICIPTYKREYLIDKLIEGIYSQNCDNSLFEVCITDNSETDETQNLIQSKYSGIENLHYKKVTCKGFLNSIEALKAGNGLLLKLHNDYSLFKEGSLQKLIDRAQKYQKDRPVIFYSLRGKKDVETFNDFNGFMNRINYLSTWSTSFSIWKVDFDILLNKKIKCNYMYPHTSLLFGESKKTSYIVDDYPYFVNVEPKKKGGYNLVDNFVRIFLGIVKTDLLDKNLITNGTYRKIELNILRFCAARFIDVKNKKDYTFSFDNKKQIITDQCGLKGYLQFRLFVLGYKIRNIFRSKVVINFNVW